MKEKILTAILDMKNKVERDSHHIYRNSLTGEKLQGVTSVSGIVPKEWLSAWGAKEAVKFLGYTDYDDFTLALATLERIKSCTLKEYLKILTEAKGAHGRKSKKAMVDGKKGHEWLEDFIKAELTGTKVPLKPDSLLRPLTQFENWALNSVKEWIASECFVVNLDKYYAGQLDAICVTKDQKLTLVDFKFASHISEEYYLQTAGYAACFEPYDISFDKRLIIRLPKTLEREEYDEINHKYRMISNDIEVKEVPTIYTADRDAYFAGLQLKGWLNQFIKN